MGNVVTEEKTESLIIMDLTKSDSEEDTKDSENLEKIKEHAYGGKEILEDQKPETIEKPALSNVKTSETISDANYETASENSYFFNMENKSELKSGTLLHEDIIVISSDDGSYCEDTKIIK